MGIAVPAYVFADDAFLRQLLDASQPAPAIVVLNIANGDADVSELDEVADALRARRTLAGDPVRVIGYVWTAEADHKTLRPLADVQARVDHWLEPRGGQVHYDGIFFDVTPSVCGPVPGSHEYRDHYRGLRDYVRSKMGGRPELVVNNPGTAVPSCYLDPAHRTADTFVTYEGTHEAYRAHRRTAGARRPLLGGRQRQRRPHLCGRHVAVVQGGGRQRDDHHHRPG